MKAAPRTKGVETETTIDKLIGIGLHTPAEAGRLIGVSALRLTRWLRGHEANGHHHEALWTSEVNPGDGKV